MKVLGMITEYNPFHNGHLYHLNASKELINPDVTICVMSGNFTQRGEPAMVNKWDRAEMAVKNGVDLVLELPFVYACNNAEYFAKGAIRILNRLGCVTHLSFGSEIGHIEPLRKMAEQITIESASFKLDLKKLLNTGISYPKARAGALELALGKELAQLAYTPNNILGIEYLKQLSLTKSTISPVTIKRIGAEYREEALYSNNVHPSAMAIRKALLKERKGQGHMDLSCFVTEDTKKMLEGAQILSLEDFLKLIQFQIMMKSEEELSEIFSMTEGLENRFKKVLQQKHFVMSSFIDLVSSKRYTRTRIQRILIHTLLNLTREVFQFIDEKEACYGRILGFNEKGSKLLQLMKKGNTARMPIITNLNKMGTLSAEEEKMLQFDILSSDIYHLVRDGCHYAGSDHVKTPYRQQGL